VLVPLPKESLSSVHAERKEVQQIAYEVDRVEDLREALKFLQEKGITIVSGLRRRGRGNDTTVDFLAPDGHNIQLYCELDQMGWEGRSRPPEQWQPQKEL